MTKALTYATHLQVPPHRRRRGFSSIFTSENFINAYRCDRIVFVHDLDVVLPLLVACVLAFKTFLLSEYFLLLAYHWQAHLLLLGKTRTSFWPINSPETPP